MKRMIKDALVGVAVALLLTITPTMAAPQTAVSPTGSGLWARYDLRETNPWHDEGSIALRIVVKARCIGAEDSAAHLRLLNMDNDRLVYGCYKEGY